MAEYSRYIKAKGQSYFRAAVEFEKKETKDNNPRCVKKIGVGFQNSSVLKTQTVKN